MSRWHDASVTDAVERARAELAAGRPWMARTRLNGALAHRQDHEVLDLLASVHYEMRDLPAAGALWFVLGREDDAAREAIEAWRQIYRHDLARWHSIPGPVRRTVRAGHVEELRAAAARNGRAARDSRSPAAPEKWWEPVVFGGCAIIAVLWVLSTLGIGMWTVFHWIWR